MRKIRKKIPVKAIACILLSLAVVYFLAFFIARVFSGSRYFNVRYVRANDKNVDLTFLLGQNIFSLDLERLAGEILAMNPAYHKISLVRRLPNSIIVELKKRKPLALLRHYRFFEVDDEGVLFNPEEKDFLQQGLPVIYGLETKILSPKAGRSYRDNKELALCLDLIKSANRIRGLRGYGIKRISVSGQQNVTFYILDNVEVRIGAGNTYRKLRLLSSLLASQRQEIVRIKYIDLRFKEPVIKYNDKK